MEFKAPKLVLIRGEESQEVPAPRGIGDFSLRRGAFNTQGSLGRATYVNVPALVMISDLSRCPIADGAHP